MYEYSRISRQPPTCDVLLGTGVYPGYTLGIPWDTPCTPWGATCEGLAVWGACGATVIGNRKWSAALRQPVDNGYSESTAPPEFLNKRCVLVLPWSHGYADLGIYQARSWRVMRRPTANLNNPRARIDHWEDPRGIPNAKMQVPAIYMWGRPQGIPPIRSPSI